MAVLELLSPANKEEPGYSQYQAKRNALFRQLVHVIELDLLVGGHRLPLAKPLPPADCYYLLSRADRRNAINREMADELFTACHQFEQDGQVRVVHLTAEGERYSCTPQLGIFHAVTAS